MKKAIYIIIAGFLVWAIWQVNKLMQYTIKFKSINFHNLTLGSISGTATMIFYNPSSLQAKLNAYNFDIYVNGKFITTINGNGPFNIKAKSETPITVDFSATNTVEIAAYLIKQFSAETEALITIKGISTIETNSGKIKKIHVNITKPLSYFTE